MEQGGSEPSAVFEWNRLPSHKMCVCVVIGRRHVGIISRVCFSFSFFFGGLNPSSECCRCVTFHSVCCCFSCVSTRSSFRRRHSSQARRSKQKKKKSVKKKKKKEGNLLKDCGGLSSNVSLNYPYSPASGLQQSLLRRPWDFEPRGPGGQWQSDISLRGRTAATSHSGCRL